MIRTKLALITLVATTQSTLPQVWNPVEIVRCSRLFNRFLPKTAAQPAGG